MINICLIHILTSPQPNDFKMVHHKKYWFAFYLILFVLFALLKWNY